jgi:hypothetical protein
VVCLPALAGRGERVKKIGGAFLWLIERGDDDSYDCADCIADGLQEGRGCGLAGFEEEGVYLVGEDKKKRTFRHEFTECPLSILRRYQLEIAFEMDWQMLRQPPINYNDCGCRFWQRVKALHSESEFHKHHYTGK